MKEVWINYGGKGDYDVQRTGTIGYHGGKKLRDVLHEKNVCVKEGIKAGYSISKSNAEITVIAPDDNNYAFICRETYKVVWNNLRSAISYLWTGILPIVASEPI